MQNFHFYLPTEICFGRETEGETGRLVVQHGGSKVLVVYGGQSARKSGLLDRIRKSLEEAGVSYTEWGGVEPNPRLAHAKAGVELAVREGVDFVLGVGGGSAIDEAKAISHGAANPGADLWEIWTGKVPLVSSLPVGAVLTIPAAGSETSDSAVLTNQELGKKAGINTPFNRPVFAVMNPELTFSLNPYQIACGVADIMMHTLERYFIPASDEPSSHACVDIWRLPRGSKNPLPATGSLLPRQSNRMTDEIAEGLLRTVIDSGRAALKNSHDYDAMSELMWCGSLSHNDLTGLGRAKDFSVHKLGHALGARFDCAHGASLTAVWGSWAEYVYRNDVARFCHFGRKVWGLAGEDSDELAKAAIGRTVDYFKEIGMPVNLTELGVGRQEEEALRALAMDATRDDSVELSFIRKLKAEDVYRIFAMANC